MSDLPSQYVTLRCVPRVDREEFLNVGVVLYCEEAAFLGAAWRVDEERLRALAPDLDRAHLLESLAAVDQVCAGTAHAAYGAGERATPHPGRRPPRSRAPHRR